MPNESESNSFSFGDALFLYLEREGQPLNIAGVSVFEGEIKLADLRAFIESKLPLIPRYRQHVVFPPFDLGLPRWEFDYNFNIRNHIRQVKLKRGTEQELKALAGKIVSTRLDRERPLWDFTLARLQGGRTGMVTRIHHCLADGIAGVGVMNVIMDTDSDTTCDCSAETADQAAGAAKGCNGGHPERTGEVVPVSWSPGRSRCTPDC